MILKLKNRKHYKVMLCSDFQELKEVSNAECSSGETVCSEGLAFEAQIMSASVSLLTNRLSNYPKRVAANYR